MSSELFYEPPRSPATPGEPRWRMSLAYAAVATLAVCWPAWPGLMSYDSLYAYKEGLSGVETMVWPPMHAYLFHLSQAVGMGPGGVFLLQTLLLFLPVALCLNLMVRKRWIAMAASLTYALAYIYVPELLGVAMVQWRDVATTSFTLLALAFWLLAARRQQRSLLVWAAASLGVATALRYNAVVLIPLVAGLMVWQPFLGIAPRRHTRALAASALAVMVGLGLASTHWRLPDFKAMPGGNNFAGVQAFDLFGISACSDKIYLPPALTDGWPITPQQVRRVYDPRTVLFAFRRLPGQPPILDTDGMGLVEAIWPRAVREEPACYLSHRASVFREQMGVVAPNVFDPSHESIDANPYGLKLAHPAAVQRALGYIYSRAPEPWRRPWIPYVLAAIATIVLWARRCRARWLATALLGGAFAYAGVLFLIGPAADARYIFPSTTVCVLILAMAAAVILDGPEDTCPSETG